MNNPLNKIRWISFALAGMLCLNGCVFLVAGGIGALGGYAISSDTVQGTVERDFEDVWDSALSVANIMGKITKQSDAGGRLEAMINNSRVTITVTQFTKKLVRVSVKARKSFFPSISTAQDTYIKVISHLDE